jgi:hypothetical protein
MLKKSTIFWALDCCKKKLPNDVDVSPLVFQIFSSSWRKSSSIVFFLTTRVECLFLIGKSLCTICFLHVFGGAKLNG